MTDPLLQTVRRNLIGDRNAGVVGSGTRELHPRVSALTNNQATVTDCILDSTELVYARNQQPVPPTPKAIPDQVSANITLVLIGGVWKEQQRQQTEGSCVPTS